MSTSFDIEVQGEPRLCTERRYEREHLKECKKLHIFLGFLSAGLMGTLQSEPSIFFEGLAFACELVPQAIAFVSHAGVDCDCGCHLDHDDPDYWGCLCPQPAKPVEWFKVQ